MATAGRVGCAAPPGAEAGCAAPLNASLRQPRDMSVGGCVARPPDWSRHGYGRHCLRGLRSGHRG
eukprot:8245696-Pyramimonas_sp.AAC.1